MLLTSRILLVTAIRSELASLRHLARWRISFSRLAYAKRRIICLSQPIDFHAFSHHSITISTSSRNTSAIYATPAAVVRFQTNISSRMYVKSAENACIEIRNLSFRKKFSCFLFLCFGFLCCFLCIRYIVRFQKHNHNFFPVCQKIHI